MEVCVIVGSVMVFVEFNYNFYWDKGFDININGLEEEMDIDVERIDLLEV